MPGKTMAGTLQILYSVLLYSDSVPICLYLLSPLPAFPIDPGQALVTHTPGTVNHGREQRQQDINWCQFTGVFLYMHFGCPTHTHTFLCSQSCFHPPPPKCSMNGGRSTHLLHSGKKSKATHSCSIQEQQRISQGYCPSKSVFLKLPVVKEQYCFICNLSWINSLGKCNKNELLEKWN